MRCSRRLLPGLLVLAVSACGASDTTMRDDRPAYRRNPAPRQAYRITMTIGNAPGPFAHMRALAHHDVVTPECLPPPDDVPGGYTSPVPTAPVEIPLQPIANGTWSAVVYADQMLDEDYHGRGVCSWQMTGFVVQMKATGAAQETLFAPSYSIAKLLAGEPETVYFNKMSYPHFPDAEPSEYESVDTGSSDRFRFGPGLRDEDLFTVTFTARKEATP